METRTTAGTSPVRLTFLPGGFTVRAACGDTILDAALEHGVTLEHECGGNCACTTCRIYVEVGADSLSAAEEVEIDRLATADALRSNARLGCQAILRGGDVVVRLIDSGTV